MPVSANPELTPWPEVGERAGLSPVQARRICDRALAKLRKALDAACLTDDWMWEEFNVLNVDEERYLALFLLSVAESKCKTPK